ncbi:MAG: Mini-ribonuclease 3 [Ruminococcaceae bacterium]|nr:Mini-ribonuclease 3 [Oscillospiraceae bacterium]
MAENLNTYSSASLAYLGDCTIELCVREYLVKEKGFSSSAKLNKEALKFVKASAQAEAMKNILDILTEEETDVFHRGRNMGHTNTPKSATVAEYRNATGMEALFGWLYLAKRQDRITELFRAAYRLEEDNIGEENE